MTPQALTRTLVPLLACAGLTAAEPAHLGPLPEDATYHVRVDAARVWQEARQVAPGTVIDDPAAASAVQRWETMLAQLAASEDTNDSVLLYLFLESLGARVSMGVPAIDNLDPQESDMRITGEWNLGAGYERMANTIREQEGEPEQIVGGIPVWDESGMTLGFAENSFWFGTAETLTAMRAGEGVREAPASAIWSHTMLAPILPFIAAMAEREPEAATALAAFAGEDWASSTPELTITTDIASNWTTNLTATGLPPLPSAVISERVASRLGDADIAIALAMDNQVVYQRILEAAAAAQGMDVATVQQQAAMLAAGFAGSTPDQLLAALDGSLAVLVSWPTPQPMPTAAMVLGTTDPQIVANLFTVLAPQARAQPADVTGASHAWTMNVPGQSITVAIGDDVTVISNDMEMLARTLGGENPIAVNGASTFITIDVPALARTWLPMLYEQLDDDPITMSDDARHGLTMSNAEVMKHLAEGEIPADASPAWLMFGDNPAENWNYDYASSKVPGDDLLATVNQSVSIYLNPLEYAAFVVWREADGFSICEDGWSHRRVSADELAQLTATMPRRVGLAPEALALIAWPEIIAIDSSYLPPIDTAIAHLPARYELSASVAEDGSLIITEHGLPLAGIASHLAGVGLTVAAYDMARRQSYYRQEAELEAQREQFAPQLEALTALSTALMRHLEDGNETPASLAALVERAQIDTAMLAPLNNGAAPAGADALNALGQWCNPEGPYGESFRIRLSPNLIGVVYMWGDAEIMNVTEEDEAMLKRQ